MVIQVTKTKTFIPKFNGNESLPQNEQVTVILKNPTVAMREKLIPPPQMVGRTGANGTADGVEYQIFTPDKKRILMEMVQQITNCAYEENGVEKPISNTTELLNAPSEFNGLVDELYQKCSAELQKTIPEKN